MSLLEIAAFITSLLAVVLGVIGSRKTWIWWNLGSILYAVLFFQSDYFGSAALQFVFIAAAFWGWFGWGKSGAKPRMSTTKERVIISVVLLASSALLYPVLISIGATSSGTESFGFVGSFIAQVLMVLERFEAWPIWLIVDAAYTYQYFTGELYLTSLLYFIFTALAVWGWYRWQKAAKANGLPKFIK
jgi:nicotinamide mononucleotide transporter